MISKYLIKSLLIIFIALHSIAWAQNGLISGFHFNFVKFHFLSNKDLSGDEYRPFYSSPVDVETTFLNFNFSLGYHYFFYRINEKYSVGINPNVGLGYLISKEFEALNSFAYDFPEYITIRYLLSDTHETAIILGLGYNYTHASLPIQSPSGILELAFNKVSLRVNYNFLKYTYYSYLTSEGDRPASTLRALGVQLILHK